jgi:hypothetical protein
MRSFSASLATLALLGLVATARAEHPDVSWMVYAGAGSCASPCHVSGQWTMESTAELFLESTHFTLQDEMPDARVFRRDGSTITGQQGVGTRLDALAGTTAQMGWIGHLQEGNSATPGGQAMGCARCHAGGKGYVTPQTVASATWQQVECLMCHATEYHAGGQLVERAVQRVPQADAASPTGFRLPLPSGTELGLSSLSITGQPTAAACLRCHGWSADAYGQRFGLGTGIADVHSQSMSCSACHQNHNHQMLTNLPGPSFWGTGTDAPLGSAYGTCATCHSGGGQAAHPELDIPVPLHPVMPANHLERIACQTCHISQAAPASDLSWGQLQRVQSNGRFLRWERRLLESTTQSERPVLRWSDGTYWEDSEPRGVPRGPGSRITPFRSLRLEHPRDLATGLWLPVDETIIGNADSLMTNTVAQPNDTLSLLDHAVREGVRRAAAADPATWGSLVNGEGLYLGLWQLQGRDQFLPVNHGVGRISQSVLGCMSCHASGDALDWGALGYEEGDPWATAVDNGMKPVDFALEPCRPNPFNNATIIPFVLGGPATVSLSVHDLQGHEVLAVLRDKALGAGRHEARIDGRNLPSGMFVYRLRANGREASGKMLMVK